MSRAFGRVWDEIGLFWISGANTCESEVVGVVEMEMVVSQGQALWSEESQALTLRLAMSQQLGLDSDISPFKRSSLA